MFYPLKTSALPLVMLGHNSVAYLVIFTKSTTPLSVCLKRPCSWDQRIREGCSEKVEYLGPLGVRLGYVGIIT
jgi:hypothetical protein